MEFKSIKNILLITGLATAASACTEDDYKLYDVSQKDSVFFEIGRASCRERVLRLV